VWFGDSDDDIIYIRRRKNIPHGDSDARRSCQFPPYVIVGHSQLKHFSQIDKTTKKRTVGAAPTIGFLVRK
jgi:hypothetical protein